eukprot:351652-Chlamydomonas_euryale.AAC.11
MVNTVMNENDNASFVLAFTWRCRHSAEAHTHIARLSTVAPVCLIAEATLCQACSRLRDNRPSPSPHQGDSKPSSTTMPEMHNLRAA